MVGALMFFTNTNFSVVESHNVNDWHLHSEVRVMGCYEPGGLIGLADTNATRTL